MHDYGQTLSVSGMLGILGWHRLDLQRVDNRLLYKIYYNLVAVTFEQYLIPIFVKLARDFRLVGFCEACPGHRARGFF